MKDRLLVLPDEEQIRARDASYFSSWKERLVHESILSAQSFRITEQESNQDLGLGLSVGTWGNKLSGEELTSAIEEHLTFMQQNYNIPPTGANLVGSTGFNESYWTRPMEMHDILPLQVAVASQASLAALESIGLTSDDTEQIDSLSVGVAAAASPLLAEYIAETLGLREDAQVQIFRGACNSLAMATNNEIDHSQDNKKRLSLVIGLETMMAFRRVVNEKWKGATDRAALSFFSDGVTAIAGHMGRFRKILEVPHEERDANGALAAIATTEVLGESISELKRASKYGVVVDMPEPKEGQVVSMRALEVTKFFLRYTTNLIEKFKKEGGKDLLPQITAAIAHRPSKPIRERFSSVLRSLGLREDLLKWNGEYGNSPSCILGYELARVLPNLKPGDKMLSFFFGAGATGQIRVDEVV